MKSRILENWKTKLVEVIISSVEEGQYHLAKLVDYDDIGCLLDNPGEEWDSLVDRGFYFWKDIDRIRIFYEET